MISTFWEASVVSSTSSNWHSHNKIFDFFWFTSKNIPWLSKQSFNYVFIIITIPWQELHSIKMYDIFMQWPLLWENSEPSNCCNRTQSLPIIVCAFNTWCADVESCGGTRFRQCYWRKIISGWTAETLCQNNPSWIPAPREHTQAT